MPSFNYITRAEARAAIRQRLQDAGAANFWADDELNDLINESLRTWNSAALYHRARGRFSATPGTAFYDISDLLSDGSELILERTLTVQQITKSIIYALMENAGEEVDGSTWMGTESFSLDDVQQAVVRRVNRFLDDTGQIVLQSQVAVTPGNGIVDIPTEWIDVRRAGWITPENAHNVLWRTSEYIADSQANDWNVSTGKPGAFSVAVVPLIRLQLLPAPDDIGTLDLLMVNAVTATGALNIFNDFAWVIKWGAISDLLGQDGEARDAERAQYAEQRYGEGVQLAKIMTTVLRGEINGQVIQPCALFDLDAGVPNWQDMLGANAFAAASVAPDTAGNPIDGTVLTLGGEVFVWVNVVINPTDVLIGATTDESFRNMVYAINANSTTALCTASLDVSTIELTANEAGTDGNSIVLSINDASYGIITAFSGGSLVDSLATPATPAFAGPNLVALYPVPGATVGVPDGQHSILFDAVRNAIIPVNDDDPIQIGREFLVVLLEMAQHLASFKIGGTEFQNTYELYRKTFQAAMGQNERLREVSQNLPIIAAQEDLDRPRKASPIAA